MVFDGTFGAFVGFGKDNRYGQITGLQPLDESQVTFEWFEARVDQRKYMLQVITPG